MEDEEYLAHAKEQVTADLDSVPTQSISWGVKLIFMEEYSDKRVGALTPYLFPSQDHAASFATWISLDDSWGERIAEWVQDGLIEVPEGVWMPLYSKAVKLAVIPF